MRIPKFRLRLPCNADGIVGLTALSIGAIAFVLGLVMLTIQGVADLPSFLILFVGIVLIAFFLYPVIDTGLGLLFIGIWFPSFYALANVIAGNSPYYSFMCYGGLSALLILAKTTANPAGFRLARDSLIGFAVFLILAVKLSHSFNGQITRALLEWGFDKLYLEALVRDQHALLRIIGYARHILRFEFYFVGIIALIAISKRRAPGPSHDKGMPKFLLLIIASVAMVSFVWSVARFAVNAMNALHTAPEIYSFLILAAVNVAILLYVRSNLRGRDEHGNG